MNKAITLELGEELVNIIRDTIAEFDSEKHVITLYDFSISEFKLIPEDVQDFIKKERARKKESRREQ